MSFLSDNTVVGKQQKSPIVAFYGEPGVGKTTLCAGAYSPFFIDLEKGSFNLNVSRSAYIGSPQTFLDYILALTNEQHNYKTIVIDSVSVLGPLFTQRVFERFKIRNGIAKSLEDYEYGKGYVHLFTVWTGFLRMLRELSNKGISVILIGHQKIVSFEDRNGVTLKAYTLNLPDTNNNSILRAVIECCDFIGRMAFETPTEERKDWYIKKQNQHKVKFAKPLEHDRVIYTINTALYLAKSRFNLDKGKYYVDEWDWGLLSTEVPTVEQSEFDGIMEDRKHVRGLKENENE